MALSYKDKKIWMEIENEFKEEDKIIKTENLDMYNLIKLLLKSNIFFY